MGWKGVSSSGGTGPTTNPVSIAQGGTGQTSDVEAARALKVPYTAGARGADVIVTSNTEVTAATIPIPALGPNDAIYIRALGACTSSAAAKIVRARLGDPASGTVYLAAQLTTSNSWGAEAIICNRNSTSSQFGRGMPATAFTYTGATGTGQVTSTVQTNAGTSLYITMISDGTDQVILRHYDVQIIWGNP